mgnify:CR=1 FL=1
MDAGFWPVLGQVKDLATLVLILALGGLGYLHITMLKENRIDRQALIDLLLKQTEAMNKISNAISAMTGKAI